MGWDDDTPLESGGGWGENDSAVAIEWGPEEQQILQRRLRVAQAINDNPADAISGEIGVDPYDTPEQLPSPTHDRLDPISVIGGFFSKEGWARKDRPQRFKGPTIKLTPHERLEAAERYAKKQGLDATTEGLKRSLPFGTDVFNALNTGHVRKATERIADGTASSEDYLVTAQFFEAARRDKELGKSIPGRAALIASQLPKYAGEFAATGGAYTAGKKLTTAVAMKALGAGVGKNLGTRLATQGAGYAVGAGFQTALNPQMTWANTERRMLHELGVAPDEVGRAKVIIKERGEGFIEALPQGFLESYIEIASERSGAAIPAGGKAAWKLLPKAAQEATETALKGSVMTRWLARNPGQGVSGFDKVLKKVGWNGVVGEMFEERVAEVARGSTVDPGQFGTTGDVLSGRWGEAGTQIAAEALAFSTVPLAGAAARGIGADARGQYYDKDMSGIQEAAVSWAEDNPAEAAKLVEAYDRDTADSPQGQVSRGAWYAADLPTKLFGEKTDPPTRAAFAGAAKAYLQATPTETAEQPPEAPQPIASEPSQPVEPEAVAPAPVAQEKQPEGVAETLEGEEGGTLQDVPTETSQNIQKPPQTSESLGPDPTGGETLETENYTLTRKPGEGPPQPAMPEVVQPVVEPTPGVEFVEPRKETWEMTRDEFESAFRPVSKVTNEKAFQKNIDLNRKAIVEEAIAQGKPVPQAIRDEFAAKPVPTKGLRPEIAWIRTAGKLPSAKPVSKAKLNPLQNRVSQTLDSFGVPHTFLEHDEPFTARTNPDTRHAYLSAQEQREDVLFAQAFDELGHVLGLDTESGAFTPEQIEWSAKDYLGRIERVDPERAARLKNDPETLRREAGSHLIAQAAMNPAFRDQLEKEQPTLLKRIIDAILEFFSVRTGKELTESEKKLVEELRAVRERLRDKPAPVESAEVGARPVAVGGRGQYALPGMEQEAESAERREAEDRQWGKYVEEGTTAFGEHIGTQLRDMFRGLIGKVRARLAAEVEQSTEQMASDLAEDIKIPSLGSHRSTEARRDKIASFITDALEDAYTQIAPTLETAGKWVKGQRVRGSRDEPAVIAEFVNDKGMISARLKTGEAERVVDLFDLQVYEESFPETAADFEQGASTATQEAEAEERYQKTLEEAKREVAKQKIEKKEDWVVSRNDVEQAYQEWSNGKGKRDDWTYSSSLAKKVLDQPDYIDGDVVGKTFLAPLRRSRDNAHLLWIGGKLVMFAGYELTGMDQSFSDVDMESTVKTRPITAQTAVKHIVLYRDKDGQERGEAFNSLSKAKDRAKELGGNASVRTEVGNYEDREPSPDDAPTVISYKDGKFVVSPSITPSQAAIGLEAVRERYKYSGDPEVAAVKDLLSGEAIKEQDEKPSEESTALREAYRKAYSAQADAEGERGRAQTSAQRIYEQQAKAIARANGVPAGRSHGSLSDAKQYKGAIEGARKEARKDPLVVESERLLRVAKEAYDAASAARRKAEAAMNKASVGKVIPEGTVLVSKAKGPQVAIRIEGFDSEAGTYDYTNGTFVGSSGQFYGHGYGGGQGERGITAAAIRSNFGTVEESMAARAIGLQALQAIEEAREDRFAKEAKVKELAEAQRARDQYTTELKKPTVAQVMPLGQFLYAKAGDEAAISDGRFAIVAKDAPKAMQKRLTVDGIRGGRYGEDRPVEIGTVIKLKGKPGAKLEFAGYQVGGETTDSALLSDGENVWRVNAQLYRYLSEDGVEFHSPDSIEKDEGSKVSNFSPVIFSRGGKRIGGIAPIGDEPLSLSVLQETIGDKFIAKPKAGRKKKASEPLAYKNPGQLHPKDSQTVEALSAHDIIATLARDFGVPIKTGRIAQPADGIYKWMEEVVRLKGRNVGNLLVATHEVAHHLDKTFSLTKTLPKALVEEMRAMDYMQGRSDRTLATKEGFAEFVRHYLTDEDAQTLAPNVSTWFDKFLHAHPDVAKNMDRARRKIDQFRSMTPEQRVAVQMQPEGTTPQPLEGSFQERVVQPILNAATARYTEWVDRLYPLKMVSDAVRKKGLRLAKGATAYALAMFSDMTAMSHAQRALNDGVHTVSENSQVIGPSLRQALEHIDSKEYDEWSRYHYARHALDSYDKRPGFNPGITLEDAQDVYNRVAGDPAKAQRYETASKAVTQFNNDLLLMLVDAGVKTPQEAEKMLAWWGETYMSLRRVKPNGIIQKLLGRGLLNVQDPVKRRSKQGSGLPVMDPIQSTILRAAEFYDAALKHQVKMALIRETVPQFGGVEGMGGFVEVVPANMKPTRAQLSDLLDQLVKGEVLDEDFAREIKAVAALRIGRISTKNLKWLAKRFGMPAESVDDIDVDALVNLTVNVPEMETVLTIWRPNYSPSAKEYIERTVIDGKPYLVQYHPDLYKALSSLSPLELGPFVKVVSEFNKVFKLGAVGLSTGFGVGNLIRDPQQFQYQTKYSEGVESTYNWARELAVFVRNDLAKLGVMGGKADDVAKLFEETGGRIATRLGTDANSLKTLRKDIVAHSTAEHSRELLAHPLQTMRDLITISDVGPRLAEFVGVLRSHGYTRNAQGHLINEATGERERPPRHVLVEAANAAADVNINYKRAGHYGRWVEQFMPFFNASVQAQDKQARTFKDAFTGQGGLQRLVISAAVFAAATAAYWWFRKDDDDYKAQADWLKYGYWTFTDSKGNPYFRVSKGFDWNIVPNLTEAFLNSLNDQQLAPLGEMMKRQGIQRMPGGQTPIGPALEVAMNYDTFRESPIETPDMERLPARERFGPHTSTLAKFVGYYTGEAVGISPAELEHLADNYTGGAYGRVSETAGHIAKADLNPTDIPGARAVLIKRDHVEDTGDFYNEKERLNEEVSAAKLRQGGAPDELADKADLFNDYATLMSELRKPIRSESDREKRFAKEKYIIGLAREALGREALDRYPSPFGRADLPEDVQAAVDSVVKGKVKEIGETYPLALTKKEKEAGKTIRQKQDDWRKKVIRNTRWLSSHGISADRAVRAYKEGSGEAKARIRARLAGRMPR